MSSIHAARDHRVQWRCAGWLYAAVLFGMNFIRIFDNNYWGDEAYTVNLLRQNVVGIIQATAADVHPPLYYLIAKFFITVLGNAGWALHLASLAATALLVVFAMTVIWDTFGREAALIMVTMALTSPNAVTYNVEIRMYSWGALFVLLSYYCLYRILNKGGRQDYILFVLSSLAAAYTHYYCVISVALLYIVMILYVLLCRKQDLRKMLVTCIVTVAAYLPWLIILLGTMSRVSGDYWMTDYPGLTACLGYLFSYEFPLWVLPLLALTGVVAVVYEYRSTANTIERHLSNWLVFLLAGALSVLGTIAVGIIVSNVIRPMFIERYIYPVSVLAWLMAGMVIAKLKGHKIYALLLTMLMLVVFVPLYCDTYVQERDENERLQETLAATTGIAAGDQVYTDIHPIYWSIAPCYYPGTTVDYVEIEELGNILPADTENVTIWYIAAASHELTAEVRDEIGQLGYACDEIVTDGNLGTWDVDIYRIQSVEN